jgi:hypothetical protein
MLSHVESSNDSSTAPRCYSTCGAILLLLKLTMVFYLTRPGVSQCRRVRLGCRRHRIPGGVLPYFSPRVYPFPFTYPDFLPQFFTIGLPSGTALFWCSIPWFCRRVCHQISGYISGRWSWYWGRYLGHLGRKVLCGLLRHCLAVVTVPSRATRCIRGSSLAQRLDRGRVVAFVCVSIVRLMCGTSCITSSRAMVVKRVKPTKRDAQWASCGGCGWC